jgi:hypothetical protein
LLAGNGDRVPAFLDRLVAIEVLIVPTLDQARGLQPAHQLIKAWLRHLSTMRRKMLPKIEARVILT